MTGRYEIDKDDFRIRKVRPSAAKIIRRCLKYFFVSIALAVIYYVFFALFFSTDTERRLKQENRMYAKLYPDMVEKEALLGDVVSGLEARDNGIYKEIFNSSSPLAPDFGYAFFVESGDSVSDEGIVRYTEAKLINAVRGAAEVDAVLHEVLEKCVGLQDSLPPLVLPIKDFPYVQTGASVGQKMSPFYKVYQKHNGLDMIVPSGTPVYSPADGVVIRTVRSGRESGNVLEIDHGNGYVTRYAHLKEILVRRGRVVKKGDLVATTGSSGKSFAPHLHYEIIRDTIHVDPVNYFFGSVSPEEYVEMMILGESVAQSME